MRLHCLRPVASCLVRRALPSPTTFTIERKYSALRSSTTHQIQNIDLPVGRNGAFGLNIIQPLKPPPTKADVVLYLPPGPLFTAGSHAGQPDSQLAKPRALAIPSLLASTLPFTTVVTLNYRLSPPERVFPGAIHDLLAGFDWIRHNLAPPRLSIYGSHIGGSLAAVLALTEPKNTHAIAISEPICDWVGLDEYQPFDPEALTKKTKKAQEAVAARTAELEALLSARSKFFRTQADYFDPFASPTLMLRNAYKDCPPDQQMPWFFGPYDDDAPAPEQTPVKKRKALKQWPPWGVDDGQTHLPRVNVLVKKETKTEKGILTQQGEELVDLMRRGCCFGKSREEAADTVLLTKVAKAKATEESVALEAANWFALVLEEEDATLSDDISSQLEDLKIT